MRIETKDPEQMTFADAGPWQMLDEQKRVFLILSQHQGKDAAISVKDLADLADLPARILRDIVSSLIMNFHVRIGSVYSGKRPGYYIIQTASEAEETVRVLRNHGISILKRAAVICRLSFPQLLNQLLLEEQK